jgi:hypothetical protein
VYVLDPIASVAAPLVMAGRIGTETCAVTRTGVESMRVVWTMFVTRTLASVCTGAAAAATAAVTVSIAPPSTWVVWTVVVVVVGAGARMVRTLVTSPTASVKSTMLVSNNWAEARLSRERMMAMQSSHLLRTG